MRKTLIALTLCLLLLGTVAATTAVIAQPVGQNTLNNGRPNTLNNGRPNTLNNVGRYNRNNVGRYNPNIVGPYNGFVGQGGYVYNLYGVDSNGNNLGVIGTININPQTGYFVASAQGLLSYNGLSGYLEAYNGPQTVYPLNNGGYNLGAFTVYNGQVYVQGTMTGLLPNAINQCTYCLVFY